MEVAVSDGAFIATVVVATGLGSDLTGVCRGESTGIPNRTPLPPPGEKAKGEWLGC